QLTENEMASVNLIFDIERSSCWSNQPAHARSTCASVTSFYVRALHRTSPARPLFRPLRGRPDRKSGGRARTPAACIDSRGERAFGPHLRARSRLAGRSADDDRKPDDAPGGDLER